jgi:serine/threonine protein phosphatase PrpC
LSSPRYNETVPQHPNGSNIEESWFLAALFDGHGTFGHVASYIAATTLPALLLQALQRPTIAKPPQATTALDSQMVQQAFDKTDALAMSHMPNEAGTTAVVAWQQGTYVHIASVGDSAAFVVQWFGNSPEKRRGQRAAGWTFRSNRVSQHHTPYRILATAVKHKPGDPIEKQRIERNGGTVYIPLNRNESSRVVYEMKRKASQNVQMALAMSRSLGDVDGKRLGVITSNCSLVSVDLRDYYSRSNGVVGPNTRTSQFFVVLASDGVMDVLDANVIIQSLGTALFGDGDPTTRLDRLQSAGQEIMNAASLSWHRLTSGQYRDDMSLIFQGLEFAKR